MNIFIDTASIYLIIILEKNNKIIDSVFINNNKKHTEQTLEQINKLFLKNNILWKNILNIYTTKGPGSYTGVRVCLTLTKTLKIINPNLNVFVINSLLYQLGNKSGFSAIALNPNKYYVGEFYNFSLVNKIKLVKKENLKNFKLNIIDYQKIAYKENYLNLKDFFEKIDNINSLKIEYFQ